MEDFFFASESDPDDTSPERRIDGSLAPFFPPPKNVTRFRDAVDASEAAVSGRDAVPGRDDAVPARSIFQSAEAGRGTAAAATWTGGSSRHRGGGDADRRVAAPSLRRHE